MLAVALAASVLLAGCGGRPAQLSRGHAIFEHSCSACHTLTGRDSSAPGGDLAQAPLSTKEIVSFVRVMPVRLDAADVETVARYVHAAAGRLHSGN
jgi:mono/diheme cytochrome c family protein